MVIFMTSNGFKNEPMALALTLAAEAAEQGEVPVAAVITDPTGDIIAAQSNRVERDGDPTAHAEMLAIKQASGKLGQTRLSDCDLWVTLEPCPMCAGAIAHARLKRLYYGAADPKSGGVDHGPRVFNHPTCHHRPDVYSGINDKASSDLLTAFFKARR